MKRTATSVVALLVSALLLLHMGLPHCGASPASNGLAVATAAQDSTTEHSPSSAPEAGHVMEIDRAGFPARGQQVSAQRVPSSAVATTAITAEEVVRGCRPRDQRAPSVGPSPALVSLQTFRC
ncbi:hypothetical protein DMB66_54115 [Actinoplanes sp. ATCC 53533]|uniref:hypothetical protein n=1 Tax=Actinoplanes sp. ATCC 53533 TaxID=1288362 RepID=UPI000F7ADAD9|nr:hypothetical protein [Actinoplanes sp. ATCC 53533]RSM42893.1 hypothetical protein DMB66_54115 [Actinoplanes sp. ATCC 53533]